LVSVIILNYNGLEFLDRCLISVLNSEYPNFEVIFVDNASTDGSVEFVRKKFGAESHLKIIQNNENLGFAEGNNIGAKKAHGEYIVFLNNDTEVDPHWLKELVLVMETKPNVGVCQSKLLLINDRKRFDCAGGLLDFYGFPFGRGDFQEDKGQYEHVEEIFHAKGAAMSVRRRIVQETGLFDPEFVIYYEEVDFCWRVRLKGYRVVFVPRSIVFHAGEVSTARELSELRAFHASKNHLTMILKNYGSENLLKYLPIIISLRISEVLLLLWRQKVSVSLAKVRAIIWIMANFKHIWQKRIKIQRFMRRIPDKDLMTLMQKPNFSRLYNHFSQLYVT